MKDFVIVYDGSLYTYRWIKTLMWAKGEFCARGYNLKYANLRAYLPMGSFAANQIDSLFRKNNTSIILFAYHHSSANFNNRQNLGIIDLLKRLHDRSNCIVWLDTADSSGTTHFEVLPYVDYYLKKQVLRDLTQYQIHHYGQRVYLDYYHKLSGLTDLEIDKTYTLLDPSYSNKIRVSWNIGLSDMWRKGRNVIMHPNTIVKPQLVSRDSSRVTDIFFNGTVRYSNLTSYQRMKICELITDDHIRIHPDPCIPMSHNDYIGYMKSSKAAFSPFGWGEVCYRDFEAITYGATLIKPDMSHLLTYPDVFIPNETYVSLEWDFSNYEKVAERVSSKEYEEIASNAQSVYYKYAYSPNAQSLFVDHFLKSIDLQ